MVNFAVTKDGLEAQLLGIVVQKEEPSLEQQKSELTVTVAAGKKQLVIEEETEKKIDEFRSGYRSAAVRAALAYFVLDDMSKVDPMYQVR